LYDILAPYEKELRYIFIVSQTELTQSSLGEQAYQSDVVAGLRIEVAASEGDKCERCWTHSTSVGSDDAHATICDRCMGVLEQLDLN